ncbi:MAG: 5'-nucleotidase SurE [Chlamydiia bacterium]|nr:5'-nucleotidase SurE [Chlamydiia bacterium]MCH9624105.1 5'-nucleotidase SurE [Chlamydiia bacterium]
MKKWNIVITNDDSVDAPGIFHLYKALSTIANVTVVAPALDQSCKGVGVSLPKSRMIEAEQTSWEGEDVKVWKVFGTPADCTKFALHYLCDKKPDFIISGINNGSNAGRNVLYSGTVGAVVQATFAGVPGIAFSAMWDEDEEKFIKAEKFIPSIVQHFHDHPIPAGTLMNINFPSHKIDGIKGFSLAKQGKTFWDLKVGSDTSLKGTSSYPLVEEWDHHDEEDNSDIHLLTEGYITCVPIHVQDLTDHRHHSFHKEDFEKLNKIHFSKKI